jgi:hypothetical protein
MSQKLRAKQHRRQAKLHREAKAAHALALAQARAELFDRMRYGREVVTRSTTCSLSNMPPDYPRPFQRPPDIQLDALHIQQSHIPGTATMPESIRRADAARELARAIINRIQVQTICPPGPAVFEVYRVIVGFPPAARVEAR